MPRSFWHAILLGGIFLGAVFGNWNDTTTGLDLDKLPHFPLHKIRSGWLKDGSRVTFDAISATAANREAREVQLRGLGRSGKPWEAHIFGLDEVWRADLDGNGTQDYVFFAGGPYFNGRMTPPFSLSILLMDSEGMPTPFFTVIYHGENGDGVKHLLDLDHNGHAELLISTYDENTSDSRVGPFCSGHWTNQLYQFKDLAAEEVRRTVGGITFPLVHDWSYRNVECAYEGIPSLPVRPPILYEHGTRKEGQAKIRKVDTATGLLTIEPLAGCKAITAKVITYDRPQLREIAFPNLFDAYAAELADRIRRAGAQAQLRGIDRWMGNGNCSVNLMWAN
jgi:hypothetical protein